MTAVQHPALTLVKTATPATYNAVGDVISYSFLVTNSGNVTLHDAIVVSDDKAADELCPDLPAEGLAPGASMTCTASYTITQGDIDGGSVTNIASAASGTTVSPSDTETVTAVQNPALTLDKTAAPTGYSQVGPAIKDMLVATNTPTNTPTITPNETLTATLTLAGTLGMPTAMPTEALTVTSIELLIETAPGTPTPIPTATPTVTWTPETTTATVPPGAAILEPKDPSSQATPAQDGLPGEAGVAFGPTGVEPIINQGAYSEVAVCRR